MKRNTVIQVALVLTHFGPGEVDEDATRKEIAALYKGEIIFGQDLMEFVPGVSGGTVASGAAIQPKKRKPESERSSTNRFVRRLDKDGDGKVSREEFDGPSRAFDRHDRNGDGFIDADEAPSGPRGGGRGGGRGR
jgi:hypothetical protein